MNLLDQRLNFLHSCLSMILKLTNLRLVEEYREGKHPSTINKPVGDY
jgi:hypothetical protein